MESLMGQPSRLIKIIPKFLIHISTESEKSIKKNLRMKVLLHLENQNTHYISYQSMSNKPL